MHFLFTMSKIPAGAGRACKLFAGQANWITRFVV
jgi:hypothetical protein